MVTVTNYAVGINSEGKSFVKLILQGDLEMIQSKTTGRFYATARRCSITSTFDEQTAMLLVGKPLPGSIIKEECDPFNYTIPETEEEISLSYWYVYVPNEPQPAVIVKQVEQVVPILSTFSSNGKHILAEDCQITTVVTI